MPRDVLWALLRPALTIAAAAVMAALLIGALQLGLEAEETSRARERRDSCVLRMRFAVTRGDSLHVLDHRYGNEFATCADFLAGEAR